MSSRTKPPFAEHPELFPAEDVRHLTETSRTLLTSLHDLILKRGEQGLIRRCHGDAHLRNIVLVDGAPVLFDAVEFSDAIATGDVLYDLAFLLMDLWERGQPHAANLVFNRYFDKEQRSTVPSGRPCRPALLHDDARRDPREDRRECCPDPAAIRRREAAARRNRRAPISTTRSPFSIPADAGRDRRPVGHGQDHPCLWTGAGYRPRARRTRLAHRRRAQTPARHRRDRKGA
jgi:hypothetical protein